MMDMKKQNDIDVEKVYLESSHKLRISLPKFVIFLGAAFLVFMFGTVLLIPLGQGVYIGDIETSKIVNVIILATIIVLIFVTFKEIRNVADACAGFVTYFVGNGRNKISPLRLKKLQGTFRSLAYVILVSLLFLMFRPLLDVAHPALAGIAVIIIVIWAIVALYSVVMAMSSEIEEAARAFTDELDKKIKKKKRR